MWKNTHGPQHSTGRKQADKAAQLPRMKYSPMPSAEVIKEDSGKRQETAQPSTIGEKKMD